MKAAFRPVEKTSLADDLVERILNMIRSGVYEPGDRLPTIMQMARDFGVGHPTVREALRKLETIGAVEIKHGSGVYVGRGQDALLVSNPVYGGGVSKKLMLDLIEARIPLEVTSVALAAANATDEDLARMTALLEKAGQHMDDAAVLSITNMEFHRAIADASGNAVMAQLQEILASLFKHEQRMILDVYGSREQDHREHLGILDGLRRRNPALVQGLMRAHLEGVREALLRWDPEQDPIL